MCSKMTDSDLPPYLYLRSPPSVWFAQHSIVFILDLLQNTRLFLKSCLQIKLPREIIWPFQIRLVYHHEFLRVGRKHCSAKTKTIPRAWFSAFSRSGHRQNSLILKLLFLFKHHAQLIRLTKRPFSFSKFWRASSSSSIMGVMDIAQVLELFIFGQNVVRVGGDSRAIEVCVDFQELVEARRPIIATADR